MNKNLKKAIKVAKEGGIIIFPTDTAFGIGCRIDDDRAVKKLFKIRRRSPEKAVPVLVSSVEMAERFAESINSKAYKLMKSYWPGGLTIVIPCKKELIPEFVRGGGDTIGVRMPGHTTTIELIRGIGVPILAPSANFSGENTPYTYSDLSPELISIVDFVMSGRCSLKKASTVVDCSTKIPKILRRGAVDVKI
ncbi:MAG TPA: L-threonylcarbamoyladenylate synthase [Patescibacteria group bacterium]|nr:L-threonylcarbamoyladenylate synthase [Patescibacteria group bacterium]